VSYADFITLMFALFTTMYAVSTVDAKKMNTLAESLSVAFDQTGDGGTALMIPDQTFLDAAVRVRELAGLREQLADHLARDIDSDLVDLRLDGRGLVISLHEAGAFATGSAELALPARSLIETVATAIRNLDNIVRVEGHTDDVPISTPRYRSNWELSTARATSVVTYLVEELFMPSERFAIAGYGEFRPLVPNDSDENRATNRRVDIVVLSTETALAEEPAALPLGDGNA
jgi:chemotaxis protein MotB